MKYLLVLIVVGVGIWILAARFRKERGGAPDKPPFAPPADQNAGAPPRAPRQMVACGHCGVHLPADEAVYDAQVPYCSAAHRQVGPR